MGMRLMNYVSLLYQDLLKAKDARLPPVLPMVVFRGERKWLSPLDVAQLIEPPTGNRQQLRPVLLKQPLPSGNNPNIVHG